MVQVGYELSFLTRELQRRLSGFKKFFSFFFLTIIGQLETPTQSRRFILTTASSKLSLGHHFNGGFKKNLKQNNDEKKKKKKRVWFHKRAFQIQVAGIGSLHSGRYPDAELVWCQEEPKNMGFWTFVQPRVNTAVRELLHDDTSSSSSSSSSSSGGGGGGGDESSSSSSRSRREVRYVGRPAAASPATG